jgi:hypothetical protein
MDFQFPYQYPYLPLSLVILPKFAPEKSFLKLKFPPEFFKPFPTLVPSSLSPYHFQALNIDAFDIENSLKMGRVEDMRQRLVQVFWRGNR